MSAPVTGLSATLEDTQYYVGTLVDGPTVAVYEFEEQNSLTITHNRHRALFSVEVWVVGDSFGDDDPPLEKLDPDAYTKTVIDSDSFQLTFGRYYTGEVRYF